MKQSSTTTVRRPTPFLRGGRKTVTEVEQWMAWRAKEDDRLYAQYGKPLEKEHTGEYVAIGPDGQTILGKRAGEVLQKAVDIFGERNFGLFRVGHRTFARWLNIN